MVEFKTKTIPIGAILTQKEMKKALKLYDTAENYTFADRCASEIIAPAHTCRICSGYPLSVRAGQPCLMPIPEPYRQ